MRSRLLLLALVCLLALPVIAVEADKQDAKGKEKDPFVSGTFSGLKFRSIGPAYCSGRIGDLAVNPNKPSEYYVAVASGHVWKTVNAGTTWTPVFDKHGAYSIGCVAMDPANSNVVWIGTGENNHQRSVSYGDGVYKSVDGGKSWKHMGLKESRHIGMIAIDPRDSRVVYVAAEGSAWGPGGDRGLYKTEDGGATWTKALEISENTGVNNVVLDPRCPDRIYATSEQRRAHVYTKIGGGPETAIHKSEDAGKTWRKLTSGLPAGHMGGIGLAVSPVNPDVIYAMIEAANDESGFYRSTDRGESWSKMSDHASSGQYYNEIYCDPKNVDKVYSVETFSFVTVDGGKTWQRLSNNGRHVDDHVIWIDPADTDHFLIGGDGGLYESWDAGATYEFKHNLPVTQFYRVNVDNSLPFYYVFGGTQDNNSMGGPSRTTSSQGIVNADWFVTQGGDGFWTAVDPTNPNIVYAEAQYGNMCRYDRQSGESVDIRPEPRSGEKTYRWFWDTPLMISPHAPARLYCAANKVFRSDDRGDTWTVISDDLTAQIDRNTIPVMGKYWSVDAVAKDVSLSQYGVILAMDESPVRENLLYVGTDDGLIQISEDARTWRKAGDFPGVPANTYVSDVQADRFNEQVVYAAFDNHKRDDFKPYLLKSADKGKTWTSIAGNLPERGTVYTVAQDHVNPDLLFAGTEFGVFFTVDGGRKWVQLTGDLPTVAVFDIAIQRRENDLVLATFGRGFYILDDYSALRQVTPEMLQADARLFPARDALMYIQSRGLSSQGSSYYSAKNPPFGATFTYYLKDAPKTRRQIRQEKEAELFKEGKPIPQPSVDELRAEEREEKPHLLFTIADAAGQVVRTIATRAGKGFNRVTWDLRYAPTTPVQLKDNKFDPLAESRGGVLAMPGPYTVSMALVTDGQPKPLAGPVPFGAVVLNNATLPAPDRAELVAFQKQAAELARTMMGSERLADEMFKRLAHIRQALAATPAAPAALTERARTLALELDQVLFTFRGQEAKASAEEIPPAPVPLNDRLSAMTYSMWRSTSKPTGTARTAYEILQKEFPSVLQAITRIHQTDLPQLEREVEAAGAPWTPGRLPVLK
ncbi:MAG TPA: glycosyl hydrolase [Acidobacteriota bacterium]|nr:glycosyl hydrolase [Acidobacteriota bacterium]HPB29101.1 glycosyl hydrolase [Acidobacteriota bacterium]HQO26216.1 glycosyl hydrolase [Acidobacteriota bacterium]HQP74757.1 glycosyl hydrolase [Acidobacteriota bacterium]